MLSLLWAAVQIGFYPLRWRVVPLFLLSFILSVVYVLPFWLGVGILLVISANIELAGKMLLAQRERLFLALVGSVVVITLVSHYQFNQMSLIYHGIVMLLLFVLVQVISQRRQPQKELKFAEKLRSQDRKI